MGNHATDRKKVQRKRKRAREQGRADLIANQPLRPHKAKRHRVNDPQLNAMRETQSLVPVHVPAPDDAARLAEQAQRRAERRQRRTR
jgi:hypothetical protein